MGNPRWLSGKESACQAGELGWVSGSGRSLGGGHGNSLQWTEEPAWTEEPGGLQSTALKKMDMTQQLNNMLHLSGSKYITMLVQPSPLFPECFHHPKQKLWVESQQGRARQDFESSLWCGPLRPLRGEETELLRLCGRWTGTVSGKSSDPRAVFPSERKQEMHGFSDSGKR